MGHHSIIELPQFLPTSASLVLTTNMKLALITGILAVFVLMPFTTGQYQHGLFSSGHYASEEMRTTVNDAASFITEHYNDCITEADMLKLVATFATEENKKDLKAFFKLADKNNNQCINGSEITTELVELVLKGFKEATN